MNQAQNQNLPSPPPTQSDPLRVTQLEKDLARMREKFLDGRGRLKPEWLDAKGQPKTEVRGLMEQIEGIEKEVAQRVADRKRSTAELTEAAKDLPQLLASEPLLAAKLTEALRTKAWFITISYQKRLKPDDPHDLQHFQASLGYPPGDLVNSLKCIARDINARQNPTAESGPQAGWV